MIILDVDKIAQPLNFDLYFIDHLYDGMDEVGFTLPKDHDQKAALYEEMRLRVTENNQTYLIKAMDEGAQTINVRAKIDLDQLRANMHINYNSGSMTSTAIIQSILPTGWTLVDEARITTRRTIELEAATDLEIIQEVASVFHLTVNYDNDLKQVILKNPSQNQPMGAYMTTQLNLEDVQYKGKTETFATRLYARGQDGLTFANINDGKDYVEDFTYSDKIVSAYWKDERYAVAQNLLEDARANLKAMAVPTQSYQCTVVDLAEMNDMYSFQDFGMYNIIELLDIERNTRLQHMVVQYRKYPHSPRQNVVTLSTQPQTIQRQVQEVVQQVKNPVSSFNRQLQAVIESATSKLTGEHGGNYLLTFNTDGQPNGFVIMDTPDVATAREVMRVNLQGIGFSHNGFNGPYESAWLLDGTFIADWITAGTLNANIIKAGILSDITGVNFFNLDTGEAHFNGTFTTTAGTPAALMTTELSGGKIRMLYNNNVVSEYITTSDTYGVASGIVTRLANGNIGGYFGRRGANTYAAAMTLGVSRATTSTGIGSISTVASADSTGQANINSTKIYGRTPIWVQETPGVSIYVMKGI